MTRPVPVFLLKWGTKYCATDVNRLTRSIRRHAERPVNILLFTDDPAGVDGVNVFRLPTDENLVGWWWKVWLFSAGIPFLYLDLDCVVVGDITSLHHPDRPLTILQDPWRAGFNSSVMSTDGSLDRVWQSFKASNAMKEMHGDQDWITAQVPDATLYETGLCRSFKAEMQDFDQPPQDCRLVYFHGKPKPLDALMRGATWIRDEWGVPA